MAFSGIFRTRILRSSYWSCNNKNLASTALCRTSGGCDLRPQGTYGTEQNRTVRWRGHCVRRKKSVAWWSLCHTKVITKIAISHFVLRKIPPNSYPNQRENCRTSNLSQDLTARSNGDPHHYRGPRSLCLHSGGEPSSGKRLGKRESGLEK